MALPWPPGDNATDTVMGGAHFNKTMLEMLDYKLYSNQTLSNQSWCLIVKEPYAPPLSFPNGTFINATWCWVPINPTGPRGKIGVAYIVMFGISIVLTLLALRKHGRMFLPSEKRFYPIGRRWQWYWALVVAACGIISLVTNIDIERYYVLELPIILAVFFWFLLQMGTMALCWEAVRHWGSWMERQYIDPDPFALRQDDRRSMVEFWVPLVFYLFLWLNFFLVVPRNWGDLEMQRSPDQTQQIAVPTATDTRFKAAAFMLFVCWLLMCFSLWHSIRHYQPRNRGLINRAVGLARFTPMRFWFIFPLSLALIAYQALCAWEFRWSVLNATASNLPIFVGGYTPALLIIYVQLVHGWRHPNEDQELIRQRRERGAQADQDLGLVAKPAWWKRLHSGYDPNEGVLSRLTRNVQEIGGGRATAKNLDRVVDARAEAANDAVEMGEMRRTTSNAATGLPPATVAPGFDAARAQPASYGGKSDRRRKERTMAGAASILFPAGDGAVAGATIDRRAQLMADGPPPSYSARGRDLEVPTGQRRPQTNERSGSTGTSNSISAPPQQVKSMLDV